jgi:hypothetical protein
MNSGVSSFQARSNARADDGFAHACDLRAAA